jgi:hypothetical protein
VADCFLINEAITSNPRLIRCSVLARNIYWTMIFACDHEGRALADPVIWIREASLFGAAAATEADVSSALAELSTAGLAPRYEVAGKAYVFLPGRFEHKGSRKYWKRSDCPLPPPELLEQYPEYLAGLRLLTTRSELRQTLRTGESRRYPQFARQIPESGGHEVGTVGHPVVLGRDQCVDGSWLIEERGGDPSETEEEATGPPTAAPPEPPSAVAVAKPGPGDCAASGRQRLFAARLLRDHSLTVNDWLRQNGASVLLDSHVTEIRARYGGRQPPNEAEVTKRRNEEFGALKRQLTEGFAALPDDDWHQWIRDRTQDEKFARGLRVVLFELETNHEADRPQQMEA